MKPLQKRKSSVNSKLPKPLQNLSSSRKCSLLDNNSGGDLFTVLSTELSDLSESCSESIIFSGSMTMSGTSLFADESQLFTIPANNDRQDHTPPSKESSTVSLIPSMSDTSQEVEWQNGKYIDDLWFNVNGQEKPRKLIEKNTTHLFDIFENL